ncbi:hypothetical protein BK742_17540 [Bacillus thuringiensis serovar pingluonsis]|uniref:Uncharacterized protein n=1 Tax=Bacillus thuringiensis serovar pingluonsis TaxID=180881 RepID=A0A243B9X8_BACTU|nr:MULTISPECIES: hypothetical protein [Bacillus cereus group]MEB9684747.1 hypothetical protein [Bacillus anthracis]OTY42045.1 hypothetical protein BK742_17540 [Bacillus thuringiensis serovar pingluonsis]
MKILQKLYGVLSCATLLVPASYSHASAEQEVKLYIHVYDSKGKLEKSFSDKEIKKLMADAKDDLPQPEITNKPYVHILDENNLLTDSTDKEAVEVQLESLATILSTYSYSATTFSSSVWVRGGAYFYNPKDITINPKKMFQGMLIKFIR